MTNKIYITGCAKTGTTLVRRLFNAFDLKVYNKDEMSIQDFLKSDYDVAKRTADTLFSNIIPDEKDQASKMMELVIINCTRNKEDTLKSDNNWVTPERYEACERQQETYRAIIDYNIEYERLMKEPDQIQKEIAKLLKLTIKHKWSDYPNFINLKEERPHTHGGRYVLRPIGKKI